MDSKKIAAAISDPGATEGFKGERTLTEWQTAAVMRVMAESMLTREERKVIEALIQLTRFTHDMLDNCETSGPVDAGGDVMHTIDSYDLEQVTEWLDKLDELPDNQPGVFMGVAAKAEWALRRILK